MTAVKVFVAATGNGFMTDIASWLVEAAAGLGHEARLVNDGSVPVDTSVINLVVAPHELYPLSGATDEEIHRAAAISIPVCTEQPGTKWFDTCALLSAPSAFVVDINLQGVTAWRSVGRDVEHLRIGGTPQMDRRQGVDRPIDVLFLGGLTDHRGQQLSTLGPLLWNRRSDLRLFTFSHPVDAAVEGLVFGTEKYDLLARSRILVNIHRDDSRSGYFEWARFVEAMANGCVVVTEPVSGYEPLQPDEHFIVTNDLRGTVAELLDNPERCQAIGNRAADAVLHKHPLAKTLARILHRAAATAGTPYQPPRIVPRYNSRLVRAQQIPLLPAFTPTTELRRRVHNALHEEIELQRRIDATRCAYRHDASGHTSRCTSQAYASAEPEVSVIVTLFDYEDVVQETLDSVVASTDISLEIIVVDDHSRDTSRAVVRSFVDRHDDVPILLIGSDANRGLPASRNLAIAEARAAKVMVLDADNTVYPTCLSRLSGALDTNPDASFAYSILEEFGRTTGLRSATGWHVPWLCEANNIDAQAMVRRNVFDRHGGYRTDDRLVFGWEDWELWLRIAAAGEHGVHVTEVLGRYRTQETSMLSTSNLFGDLMRDHLCELYPALPWPRDHTVSRS